MSGECKDYRKIIVEAGKRLISSGLTVETWGNISVLNRDGLMFITPSGIPYCDIKENDVAVMDLDGNILSGDLKPSSENPMHRAIYRARPDVKAIVHTHPVYSTVFSCMGEDIPFVIDEAWQALGDIVHTSPYHKPGTEELAKDAAKFLGEKGRAVLLQSHGAVCVGANIREAFIAARVLEMTAEVYYRIRSMGGDYKKIV